MGIEQKIEELSKQINELARQQTGISKQIIQLMDELAKLKTEASAGKPAVASKVVEFPTEIVAPSAQVPRQQPVSKPKKKSTLEEFIGGNLTSKVGILITIIGIFIGSKYAIEHDLVNPKIRVLMGYVSGVVLIGIAIRLKKKYEKYSAVLMGGGLAVLYFITYVAYSFYGMIPQLAAFGLMLLFTAATVYASLLYNQIIIAHLALVGAYAIPFLLSDNSGRYEILFTYIAIINAGMMVLSFKKYWKSLFYVSFLLTWSIYTAWRTFMYTDNHLTLALVFLLVFFLIFYVTFLSYKLIRKELYSISDVAILLSNAFIFYGLGYSIMSEDARTANLLGVFTLGNAALHLIVSLVIRQLKLADKALLFLLFGLVITFVTIAVPVQLDGNWVTLLWTVEAVLVFYIGRTQKRASYEMLAAGLTLLSFFSLMEDWLHVDYLLPGLMAAAGQAAIIYIHYRYKINEEERKSVYLNFYDYAVPVMFLATIYFTLLLELNFHFIRDRLMQSVMSMLYSMVFIAVVALINERFIKNKLLRAGTAAAGAFVLIIFLVKGLMDLNRLESPLRYASFAAAAVLLIIGRRQIRLLEMDKYTQKMHSVFTHIAILTMISFEYLHWMRFTASVNEYKLGLSIVWGVYALCLVVMGINKKKKHWRLTGMAFFIITLVKLFVYDISRATTISQTISFISLGVILLLVSYLYNRYKQVILADDE